VHDLSQWMRDRVSVYDLSQWMRDRGECV
jgi:hypothetical protein